MAKDIMSVEIENRYIKILVGDRRRISQSAIINTPKGAMEDNKIVDVEAIAGVLKEFINSNKITADGIAYTIQGQDTIIRHTEIAIMQEIEVGKAAIMEIGQYLPRQGVNYYIDYQIIDKINTEEKKVFRVLVAAVPRVKVNGYVELTEKLGMKLKAIDILPISISRIFKNYFDKNKEINNIGIIDIENLNSSIVILDHGKIFIEKEINKGISNAVEEIAQNLNIDYEKAYFYFMSKFNFAKQSYSGEMYEDIRNNFDEIFRAFDRIVKFYTSGKVKKTLDKIFIVGEGAKIYGVEAYLQDFMDTDVSVIDSAEDINLKINFKDGSKFKYYSNVYGAILRKSKKELNLIPDNKRKFKTSILNSNFFKASAAGLIILFVAASAVPIAVAHSYSNKQKNDEYKVQGIKKLQVEHDSLAKKIATYNSRIKLVDKLTKSKVMLNKKIEEINKYVPSDIKFDSISFDDNNGIVLSGETANSKAPAALVANLQMSNNYKNARLMSVTNSQNNKSNANNNVYNFIVNLGDGSDAENNAKR